MLKSEQVYRGIKQRILNGTYTEGYRLILEELAGDFHVSHLPVREAIQKLESEGLVAVRKHSSAEVRKPDRFVIEREIGVLALLEGSAAAQSIAVMTAEELSHAAALNEKMRSMLSDIDPKRFVAVNEQFHQLLCSRCPNTRLLALLEGEWDSTRIVLESAYTLTPWEPASTVAQHDALLKLARSGATEERLEKAFRRHRLRVIDHYDTAQRVQTTRALAVI